MPELSRNSLYAAPTKSPVAAAAFSSLPAHSAPAVKPVALAGAIPSLPNSAGLADAVMGCSLPRESLPRIMNPADVPLTDASRFVSPL